MKPDSPLSSDSRRDFVKKSLAASIVAAQPSILAGLIRAEGGGGGETTTDPWETTTTGTATTDYWETGTTVLETTTSPETTVPPQRIKTRKFEIKLYLKEVLEPRGEYVFTTVQAEAMHIDLTNEAHLDAAHWPQSALGSSTAPKLGGFLLELVGQTFVPTNADPRASYPKFFPPPEAATFVDVVEDPSGNYNVKGYEMEVNFLWVYENEQPPPGADDSESVVPPTEGT